MQRSESAAAVGLATVEVGSAVDVTKKEVTEDGERASVAAEADGALTETEPKPTESVRGDTEMIDQSEIKEGGATVELEESKIENDLPIENQTSEKALDPSSGKVEDLLLEEQDDGKQHVLFANDDWTECITESVWFGQKIPQKRRHLGRSGSIQKDPVALFFDNAINLAECRSTLLQISESYTKSSAQHDREWEGEDERREWARQVKNSCSCEDLIPLILQLDNGMSLPTSLCQRKDQNGEPGRVQRYKLQLFKFWPSQDMKQAWKAYIDQEGSLRGNNIGACTIILKILETVCQQFIIRQAEKMERKNRQAIQQAIQNPAQPERAGRGFPGGQAQGNLGINGFAESGRHQRAAVRQAIKYFESSEEEDDEEEDQEDAEEEVKHSRGSRKVQRSAKADGEDKSQKDSQSEQEEVDDDDDDQGAGSGDEAKRNDQQDSDDDDQEEEEGPGRKQTRGKARNQKQQAQTAKTAAAGKEMKTRRSRRAAAASEDHEMEDQTKPRGGKQEPAPTANGKANSDVDDEEGENSREWDEYCYVCNDGGNVMCCDGCPQVAHKQCVNLKSLPKGKWFCQDCLDKQNSKINTRLAGGAAPSNAAGSINGTSGRGSQQNGKHAPANQVMQTRATRRSMR